LTGRIDQVIRSGPAPTLREIKTVTCALPADEAELRADYPEYFVQLATYLALARLGLLTFHPETGGQPVEPNPLPAGGGTGFRGELIFVEVGSGLAQTVVFTSGDDAVFRAQLERVTEFLNLRLRARTRLRNLRYRPAFDRPRPGQETTQAELTALFERRPLVLFEAPTGFGKTGVLLEFALGQLRSGHFDRALYLTSKSTGQLQVVRTLGTMAATAPTAAEPGPVPGMEPGGRSLAGTEPGPRQPIGPEAARATPPAAALAVWQVRAKSEHCINATFHCVRDTCSYLAGAAERWPGSGLARFYLDEKHARDLDTLRAAGRAARICPYEITRAALAFNDVWIGDYNYVFAPRNRGLFHDQPGFAAGRTLLLVDEAHNLPARVADAYSHGFTAGDAFTTREELHRIRPPANLITAWDHWCHGLQHLRRCDALTATSEDDLRHLLAELARLIPTVSIDLAALGPHAAEVLWRIPALMGELATTDLTRLWWCPQDGELALTCLDAAPAIGTSLREFGGVVLASATLNPLDSFAAACGLDGTCFPLQEAGPSRVPRPAPPAPPGRLGALNLRETRKLYRQLTSAAELLRVEEAREAANPVLLRAHTPWRDGAYDIAIDARVDTTFQHRSHHYTTTAATIAALQGASAAPSRTQSAADGSASCRVVAFFPSYAYAEAIARELAAIAPDLRVALQPKLRDLAAQAAWVGQSLLLGDVIFLVLGSSFAESIDLLGGRVSHAMVVGPALPEVNAVQRARLAQASRQGASREEAFRRVYQIPGMTKVNQALGRLVRAPGQGARVLLHCRRFLEPGYAALLAPEYQGGAKVADDAGLELWLDPSRR
jgi:Rad3-related DNA helicase